MPTAGASDYVVPQWNPQPLSFAMDAQDATRAAKIFGSPTDISEIRHVQNHQKGQFTYIDAFANKSTFLGNLIYGLAKTRMGYLTSFVLPFREISGIEITWTSSTYETDRAGVVPELGVGRELTWSKAQHTVGTERRGLALRQEHDSLRTQEGVDHFFAQIKQISLSMQKTAEELVIETLFAHAGITQFSILTDRGADVDFNDVIKNEIVVTGLLNKNKEDLGTVVRNVTRMIEASETATADFLIVPVGSVELMKRRNDIRERKDVYVAFDTIGGDKVSVRISNDSYDFDGLSAFEMPHNSGFYRGVKIQDISRRNIAIGEYYALAPIQHLSSSRQPYTTAECNTQVYNWKTNGTTVLRVVHAIENCGIFNDVNDAEANGITHDEDGKLYRLVGDIGYGPGGFTVEQSIGVAKEISANHFKGLTEDQVQEKLAKLFPSLGKTVSTAISKDGKHIFATNADYGQNLEHRQSQEDKTSGLDDLTLKIYASYLLSPFTKKTLINWAENDVRLPVGFFAARPKLSFSTGSALVGISGTKHNTGIFATCNSNFQMSNNAATKYVFGAYTVRMAPVLFRPRAVGILDNIVLRRYLGGGGVEAAAHGEYSLSSPASEQNTKDVLYFLVGYEEQFQLPEFFDLAGRNQLSSRGYPNAEGLAQEPLHYSTAKYYASRNEEFDLAPRDAASEGDTLFFEETPVNSVVCRGYSEKWDYLQEQYSRPVWGIGHLGDYTGPGSKDAINLCGILDDGRRPDHTLDNQRRHR